MTVSLMWILSICLVSGLSTDAQPLTLIEETRFGEDSDDDAFLWSGANTGLAVNGGRVYVFDPGSHRVLCFDQNGSLLFRFGAKGQGPGEFQTPTSFSLLDDGRVVVFENQQGLTFFHFFDADGEFLRRQTNEPIELFLQSAIFSPGGKTIGSLFMAPDPDGEKVFVKTGVITVDLDVRLELTSTSQTGFDPSRSGDGNYWAEFLAQWFKLGASGLGLVTFTPDGGGYTAVSNDYAITAWQPGFEQPRGTIERDHKPRFQSEEEILMLIDPIREQLLSTLPPNFANVVTESVVRKAVRLAELPPARPPLFGLIAIEDKGLLAISEYDQTSGEALADVFSIVRGDHVHRGRVKLPPISVNLFEMLTGGSAKLVFSENEAYALEREEGEDVTLVRYAYTLE